MLQDFAKFCKNVSKFFKILKILAKFCENFGKILQTFFTICSRKDDFLVDLEKCCKMRPWLQKSASIQPRTSPGKSDVSWLCSWLSKSTSARASGTVVSMSSGGPVAKRTALSRAFERPKLRRPMRTLPTNAVGAAHEGF